MNSKDCFAVQSFVSGLEAIKLRLAVNPGREFTAQGLQSLQRLPENPVFKNETEQWKFHVTVPMLGAFPVLQRAVCTAYAADIVWLGLTVREYQV